MGGNSTEASIYNFWMKHLSQGFLMDYGITDEDRIWALGNLRGAHFVPKKILQWKDKNSKFNDRWCLNPENKGKNYPCLWSITHPLESALLELADKHGSDMNWWKWDQIHIWEYTHTPFHNVNYLKPFFDRSYHSGGTLNTLYVSGSHPKTGKGYWAAIFRFVASMKEDSKSYIILDQGMSENIFS